LLYVNKYSTQFGVHSSLPVHAMVFLKVYEMKTIKGNIMQK